MDDPSLPLVTALFVATDEEWSSMCSDALEFVIAALGATPFVRL